MSAPTRIQINRREFNAVKCLLEEFLTCDYYDRKHFVSEGEYEECKRLEAAALTTIKWLGRNGADASGLATAAALDLEV